MIHMLCICLQCKTKITSLNLGKIKQHYARKTVNFPSITVPERLWQNILETYRNHISEILMTGNCNVMHMGLFYFQMRYMTCTNHDQDTMTSQFRQPVSCTLV